MGRVDEPRSGLPLPHGGLRHRYAGRCHVGRRSDPQGLRRPDALDCGSQPARRNDRGTRDPHRHRTHPRRRVVLRQKRGAAGWKHYFIGGETPPLSALVVDRARGWPALSPPLLAARSFREALTRRGVTVVGRPGLGIAPLAATTLASDVSDPLSAIVRHMNHESDNFYAEMLLKQLPAAAGRVGTSAGGAQIVIATMREAGIPVAGIRMVDGSGLSSLDRLTADALVGVIGGRRHGRVDQGRVHRLACGRRCERNAQPPPAVASRPGEGQDGDDRPGLHAVGPDPQRGRVRGARERKSRLLVGGARRPRIVSSRSSRRQ